MNNSTKGEIANFVVCPNYSIFKSFCRMNGLSFKNKNVHYIKSHLDLKGFALNPGDIVHYHYSDLIDPRELVLIKRELLLRRKLPEKIKGGLDF